MSAVAVGLLRINVSLQLGDDLHLDQQTGLATGRLFHSVPSGPNFGHGFTFACFGATSATASAMLNQVDCCWLRVETMRFLIYSLPSSSSQCISPIRNYNKGLEKKGRQQSKGGYDQKVSRLEKDPQKERFLQ